MRPPKAGPIVILNGAPRSGKSCLAEATQAQGEGVWIHLEVDQVMAATPPALHPGIGLRPGGERPDLETLVAALYRALYASIAAHSREGLSVVADVGHHDDYSQSLGTLAEAAPHLEGLPAYLVGVRCPVDVVVARRLATGWAIAANSDGTPAAPILRWERAVHDPGIDDLEVDTSLLSPVQAADRVRQRLEEPLTCLGSNPQSNPAPRRGKGSDCAGVAEDGPGVIRPRAWPLGRRGTTFPNFSPPEKTGFERESLPISGQSPIFHRLSPQAG